MIATDIIQTVREQIADHVELVSESPDRIAVYTPFMYRDGDHCGFFLERDPSSDQWHIRDEGDALAHASYMGTDLLSSGWVGKLRATLEFYGLEEKEGELLYPVEDRGKLGEALFLFSQASLNIVNLSRVPPEHRKPRKSKFSAKLHETIASCFKPEQIEQGWHDDRYDQNKNHPVDYRARGDHSAVHLFKIIGDVTCLKAANSCNFYRRFDDGFQGVAVFEHEDAVQVTSRTLIVEAAVKTFSYDQDKKELEEFLQAAN